MNNQGSLMEKAVCTGSHVLS